MVEKYSKVKKRASVESFRGMLPILKVLNEMVEDKVIEGFAIGGGAATSLYAEPYTTKDIDVFCYFKQTSPLIDLSPIYTYLKARGAKVEGEYLRMGLWPVQFVPPTDPVAEDALKNAVSVTIKYIPTKLFSPEYIVAVALNVGREKDRRKIEDLLRFEKVNISLLEEILKTHNLMGKWEAFKKRREI